MSLIVFILVVYGIVNILIYEHIFKKQVTWLRKQHKFLDDLLGCPTCLAFWIGAGLFLVSPMTISGVFLLDILLAGFIGSGATNLLEHIKIRLGI